MTMKEFYSALAETKNGGWIIYKSTGIIRCISEGSKHCPITKVAVDQGVKGVHNTTGWVTAHRYLGLDLNQTDRIIKAADNVTKGAVRKRLLEALGLEEVVTAKPEIFP